VWVAVHGIGGGGGTDVGVDVSVEAGALRFSNSEYIISKDQGIPVSWRSTSKSGGITHLPDKAHYLAV
jgi:hypothetical protein